MVELNPTMLIITFMQSKQYNQKEKTFSLDLKKKEGSHCTYLKDRCFKDKDTLNKRMRKDIL